MDPITVLLILLLGGSLALTLILFARHRALSTRVADAAARLGASAGEDPIRALIGAVRREEEARTDAETRLSFYESTLARADFGMLVVDREGEILFTNPVARQFLGARHGHAVAEARIKELLDEVSATLSEQTMEIELYTPSRRYLGLYAVPLFDDGEPSGAALYLNDLSERYRVEAMRRDFVANASHELKTPLGALRVLAEALAATDDGPTRARLTTRLLEEGARMSRLIDDILNLALVEGAAAAVSPVRVSDLLSEARREVASLAKEHSIPIELDDGGSDLIVGGDRMQLVSALSNLLENAIKYTAVGSPDDHETVRLRARGENGAVVIEVEDHGIGIPESHQHRVFERFYRVDRARSRETGGTGLGLAIVRHVVMNHGGTVALRSAPGVGSTFEVSLPRWEQ